MFRLLVLFVPLALVLGASTQQVQIGVVATITDE
jgi:hypothetical protein